MSITYNFIPENGANNPNIYIQKRTFFSVLTLVIILRLQKQYCKMALAESQCYTIINSPELTDVYNEMKIKKELGKSFCCFILTVQLHISN